MRACRISMSHFRGISAAKIILPKHAVLIGDNNTGKTTVLEALDLTLGPDRINRRPPIDEHDFFQGRYLGNKVVPPQPEENVGPADAKQDNVIEQQPPPRIEIEVAVTDLSEEQKARFGDYVEFWDSTADRFYDEPDPAGVSGPQPWRGLRVQPQGLRVPI